jgi:hypothetical protein
MAAGGSALLVLIGGSAAGIAVLTEDEARTVNPVGQAAPAREAVMPPATATAATPTPTEPVASGADARASGADSGADDVAGGGVDRRTSDQADRTGTREPRRPARRVEPPVTAGKPPAAAAPPPAAPPPPAAQPPPAAPPQPAVTTRTATQTRAVPYRTRMVRDPHLRRGDRRVRTPGVTGEEKLRYLVTYTDGRETGRRLVDTVVVRQPQHRVVAFGTRRVRGHDRPGECRKRPCFPIGRAAVCDEPVEPEPTGSATPRPSEPVPAPDRDGYLREPGELDGLGLEPTLICWPGTGRRA